MKATELKAVNEEAVSEGGVEAGPEKEEKKSVLAKMSLRFGVIGWLCPVVGIAVWLLCLWVAPFWAGGRGLPAVFYLGAPVFIVLSLVTGVAALAEIGWRGGAVGGARTARMGIRLSVTFFVVLFVLLFILLLFVPFGLHPG